MGSFIDEIRGEKIVKVYHRFENATLLDLRLSLSEAKRAAEFVFELDTLLPVVLENEAWTNCAAFRIDSIILIFHEKLYREKAKVDYTSFVKRFKSRFTNLPNEKMAHLCRKAAHELELKHYCKKCTCESIVSVDFPILSYDLETSLLMDL